MQKAKIDCSTYYNFNNSALFASNKKAAQASEDEDDENFDEFFWKMGFISFKKFFKAFCSAKEVSLHLTKEVLREREQLETTVQALQHQIRAGCAKLEELRLEEIVLQQRKAEIATNKDFTYTVNVQKQRKVPMPTGHYVTNCLTCNYTCHVDCPYKVVFKSPVMDGGGNCTACPKNCFWQEHVNNPYQFELYMETETRTSEKLYEKYETALQRKSKAENTVNQINRFLQTVESDVTFKVDELQQSLQHLDKIALKQSPLSQVVHINLLIEAEKHQAHPGYQQRVKFYERAKQEAEILEKVKNDPESLLIQRKREEEIRGLNKKHQKTWFNPLRYW